MKSRTLLVVDDALIIREIIKQTATDNGWEIVGEAGDGRQAVDRYAEVRPDAVTLDLVMPQYDGLYALREITSLDAEAQVVVVSALEQKNILKEAFKLGAVDFVVKPFDKKVLAATLDKLDLRPEPSPTHP
ncbi:MAG: response regulator [Pirellulales bacterium]|jgi:two-component system, chemotaxis family, chemotaxis protein CheY